MATVKLDPAKGIQIPNLTTTERNAISSPETGAIIWNTTTSEINQYNGSAWEITYTPVAGITSSADATAITIDSSENVGIGVTPAMASSSYNGLHIGATYPTMKLSSNSSGHAAADGFHLRIDSTPRVEYWNYENTDQVFSNNNSEKIRILAGGGITFNGDTATANALDDYEEGNWTVTSSDSASGFYQSAHYVKVGGIVHVRAYFGDIGGGTTFAGLPFATEASTALSIHQMYQVNWPSSAKQLACYVSGSNIYFRWQTDTGVGASLSSTDTAHSSCTFGIAGTYKTTA
jgi:hypothetical protein